MSLKQDIAGAEAYIVRANRHIQKQRRLIGRSRKRQTIATGRDVIEVLSLLLANVQRQHERLRKNAGTSAARRAH